uniref:Uncharacterized protein n=1 Tax=Anguilla anguilla TaxID=7936 RepID=A0A0E9W075_ANGAN
MGESWFETRGCIFVPEDQGVVQSYLKGPKWSRSLS